MKNVVVGERLAELKGASEVIVGRARLAESTLRSKGIDLQDVWKKTCARVKDVEKTIKSIESMFNVVRMEAVEPLGFDIDWILDHVVVGLLHLQSFVSASEDAGGASE